MLVQICFVLQLNPALSKSKGKENVFEKKGFENNWDCIKHIASISS